MDQRAPFAPTVYDRAFTPFGGDAVSTRLSVNINDETAAAIRESMDRHQTTATMVLHRAIGVYAYLSAAQQRGDRIEVHDLETDETMRVRFLP